VPSTHLPQLSDRSVKEVNASPFHQIIEVKTECVLSFVIFCFINDIYEEEETKSKSTQTYLTFKVVVSLE